MSTTLLPASNDDDKDDKSRLQPRKEKRLEPISSARSYGVAGYEVPAANEDLLEELRRKTAALAGEMAAERKAHSATEPTRKKEHAKTTKDTTDALIKELEVKETIFDDPENDAAKNEDDANPAVTMVREKLSRIYEKEPNANEEIHEVESTHARRSKHQQFMYDLTTSGKSLADIQTAWHNYYVSLPDKEKHEVWQEFYMAQKRPESSKPNKLSFIHSKEHHAHKDTQVGHDKTHAQHKTSRPHVASVHPKLPIDPRNVGEIKAQIIDKISAGGKLTAVHHAKSLLFGLGLSALVLLIITFIFFNEAYIAPFISPNQSVSATPIIGEQNGPVGPEPKIVIPKINLEVPVVFGLNTITEDEIQNALEGGVVHYASSPNPGEVGNSVIVGHSSNNILNKGKYKFAFVLLKRLEAEDTFFVHKDGVRYTYKVYKKEIVAPDNVSVLGTQERANTITLITCDPPGTSVNRLIITAEQISPDPAGNKTSTAPADLSTQEQKLPSNAPSLWSRLWPF